MAKTNCINHVKDTYMAILREDYYILCAEDHCAAIILNDFEHWMNVKLANNPQAEYETILAKACGKNDFQSTGLWVWKTQEQLKDEMYGMFGVSTIRRSLEWLVENKYLLRRRNPKYNWDRTYQYMINVEKVQEELNNISARLEQQKEAGKKEEENTNNSQEAILENARVKYNDSNASNSRINEVNIPH